MRIIAISGKAGAGKNTVAKMLHDIDPNYTIISFGDKLKEICSSLTSIPVHHWEQRKFKEQHQDRLGCSGREYMVRIGQALRNADPDILIKALFADLPAHRKYIIADARTCAELEAVKLYGGTVIRIERIGLETGNDITETELDCYPYFDYTVQNNSSLSNLFFRVLNIQQLIAAQAAKPFWQQRAIQIL